MLLNQSFGEMLIIWRSLDRVVEDAKKLHAESKSSLSNRFDNGSMKPLKTTLNQ